MLNGPLFQGNSRLPEIALTFDDGPQPSSTPQILAILQRSGIEATFFCIGRQVQAYPALIRQEQAAGNLVEDHTWSHPNLTLLPTPLLDQQLALTARAILRLTGTPPAFLRPPYGAINASVLARARRLNLSLVLWNVDPRDWSLPGSATIVARVLSTTHNGSIILLHDGGGNRAQTIAALPGIIRALRARGLRFVTIQQLIDDLPPSL
jgi:peptidoglycan/xylan/chitin deacetylase (PgdA/CDA1 family)